MTEKKQSQPKGLKMRVGLLYFLVPQKISSLVLSVLNLWQNKRGLDGAVRLRRVRKIWSKWDGTWTLAQTYRIGGICHVNKSIKGQPTNVKQIHARRNYFLRFNTHRDRFDELAWWQMAESLKKKWLHSFQIWKKISFENKKLSAVFLWCSFLAFRSCFSTICLSASIFLLIFF